MTVPACRDSDRLDRRIERYGLSIPGGQEFRVVEEFSGPAPGTLTVRAAAQDHLIRLRVHPKVQADEARREVEDERALLRSMFVPSLPPYPEFVTRETGCPEAFQPDARESEAGSYVLLYASSRLGYGVCSSDLAQYRAAAASFYCAGSGTVFHVEQFVPAGADENRLTELMEGMACR